MTYSEAREYLDSISARGNCLGLESVRRLMDALGNPQDDLKFVHIAGTNGKGSVMAYLEETLIRSGYRVGRYVSPALFEYEEKFRVNAVNIEKEKVALLTEKIKPVLERFEREGGAQPTIFEVETAMSFLWFVDEKCDIVLLETGMGGETDATNIVKTTVLEVFSSISLDHMEFLGNTTGDIARVKAGIIKPGTMAVSDAQDEEAGKVLCEEAARKNASIRFADPSLVRDISYGLAAQSFSYKSHIGVAIRQAGTYQIANAALALEAVDALRELGMSISEEALKNGFEDAYWPGRFEVICEDPLMVIDGAHNPDAALALRGCIEQYFKDRSITLIFGVFSDKDYDKIIEIMAPLAGCIYTVETTNNPRALPAKELTAHVKKINPHTECLYTAKNAVDRVFFESRDGLAEGKAYVFFGSLSWLHEVKEAYEEKFF